MTNHLHAEDSGRTQESDYQRLDDYLASAGWRSPRAWRDTMKQFLTTAVLPIELLRARRIQRDVCPLRLHLGAGDTRIDGWVDIDLFRPGRELDLRWDLRRGLPFSSSTVDAIFSEHLLEHIGPLGGLALLRECYRALKPGGILRAGVPDLGRYVRSYEGQDPVIDQASPGRPTRAMAFNEVFFSCGHRWMYDAQTLLMFFGAAGFQQAACSEFGCGGIMPNPDNEHRRNGTLYVEAVK